MELSPVFLRELWKRLAADKKKHFVATEASATRASALESLSGIGGVFQTSLSSLQPHVRKRKS